jgi:hypothetical protein
MRFISENMYLVEIDFPFQNKIRLGDHAGTGDEKTEIKNLKHNLPMAQYALLKMFCIDWLHAV